MNTLQATLEQYLHSAYADLLGSHAISTALLVQIKHAIKNNQLSCFDTFVTTDGHVHFNATLQTRLPSDLYEKVCEHKLACCATLNLQDIEDVGRSSVKIAFSRKWASEQTEKLLECALDTRDRDGPPLFHLQPDIRPSPQAPRGIQVGENDIIVVEGKNKEEEMIENLLGVDLVDDDAVGDAW